MKQLLFIAALLYIGYRYIGQDSEKKAWLKKHFADKPDVLVQIEKFTEPEIDALYQFVTEGF